MDVEYLDGIIVSGDPNETPVRLAGWTVIGEGRTATGWCVGTGLGPY